MTEPLSAMVVGGGFAGRLALDALVASPRFVPVAVADNDPDTRTRLRVDFPTIAVYEDYASMYASQHADVVCISTPPAHHEAPAVAAVELRPRGIIVEKPIGHRTDSAARILAAIEQAQIPVMVPHGLVVQATAREVVERVQSGEIGELELIEIRTRRWDILSAGIHWLQLCVRLMAPDAVDHVLAICESSTRTYRDGLQVETTAVTYVEATSGLRIVMVSGDDVRTKSPDDLARFRLVGSAGQIEMAVFVEGYWLQNAQEPTGKYIEPPPLPGSAHQRIFEMLADQIDRGVPDYTLARESMTALTICEAAYVSSRHRCKVTFPFADFVPSALNDWDPGQPYDGFGGGRDGRRL